MLRGGTFQRLRNRSIFPVSVSLRLLNISCFQPFKDEAVVAREKYVIDRNNYFAKVSPSILSEINRRRQNKGKAIIQTHKAEADKRPLSPFFLYVLRFLLSTLCEFLTGRVTHDRYLADFRTSSPAADIKSSSPHGGAAIIEIAKQAAKNWREMSDSDKAVSST